MTRFMPALLAIGLLVGCAHRRCAPGQIPNDVLQGCVIPPQCDGGIVNERNECVPVDAAMPTISEEAGEGQTTSAEMAQAAGAGAAVGGPRGPMDGAAGTGDGVMSSASSAAGSGGSPAEHSMGASCTDSKPGVNPDGCCPAGANANNDADCKPACGNGVKEAGELCDGTCPTSDTCKSTDRCLVAKFSGDPHACTSTCDLAPISTCKSGDECCAPGCNYDSDTDCSRSCGDGVVTAPETCEPSSKTQPCASSCDDGDPCTADMQTGTSAQCNVVCSHPAITAAASGDRCCPPGANATSDSDCKPACGNGVKETGELCDGNCPSSCDDGKACSTDTLSGAAASCDATCTSAPITACKSGDGCCAPGCTHGSDSDCPPPPPSCGDGHVDPGETCDGNCFSSCTDDGVACTAEVLTGSAANCNTICNHVPITACKSGDGCCPQGCKNSANGGNDNDCVVQPGCGNGLLDTDETCDDTSSTKCLTTCSNGDACSKSVLSGSAQACSLKCMPTQITGCISGDGCCAPGCKNSANGGTDDDCALAAAICGNGIVEPGEGCDGHCPTAADCNDGDVCTDDGIGGDPCHIVCVHRCRTAQLDPLDTAPPGSCTTSRQLVSPMCAPDAGPWQ